MRLAQRLLCFWIVAILGPSSAIAQPERYELARRLVRMETAWETATESARQEALKRLPPATSQFFALKLGEAGRTLDQAWYALQPQPTGAAEQFADSFYVLPSAVVFDPKDEELSFTVRPFFPSQKPEDSEIQLVLEWAGLTREFSPAAKPIRFKRTEFPPNPKGLAGSSPLKLSAKIAGQTRLISQVSLWSQPGLRQQLDQWKQAYDALSVTQKSSIEAQTALARLEDFNRWADGEIPESNRPYADLWQQIPAWLDAAAAGKPWFGPSRSGDQSLRLSLAPNRTAAVRLWVPPDWKPGQRRPLVVAMHGAGGSENMFFESYGAGYIVQECQKRGWMLLATRAGLLSSPPLPEILKSIEAVYPIQADARFVVGHSMGAGQAAEWCQRQPDWFRGIGLLGGAARLRNLELAKSIPWSLAVGDQDQLAFQSTKRLYESLQRANATRTTLRVYPGVEHLVIVRVALPDLFERWEQSLR